MRLNPKRLAIAAACLLLGSVPAGSAAQGVASPAVEATAGAAAPLALVGTAGTKVTISGANFGTGGAVRFGTSTIIALTSKCSGSQTGCIVSSSTSSISVKAPAGSGMAAVNVCPDTTCSTVASNYAPRQTFDYNPAITGLSTHVFSKAGMTLTISGGHFGTATPTINFKNGSTVVSTVNSKCASTTTTGCVKSVADSSIVVAPPTLSSCLCTVEVQIGSTVADDLTNAALGTSFDYNPATTGVTPNGGQPGATITIKGTNLGTSTPTIRFANIGTSSGNLDVSAKCSSVVKTNCIAAATATAISVKAPTPISTSATHAVITVCPGGNCAAPADDLTSLATTPQASSFDYGPLMTSLSASFAKPGGSMTVKGVNFGKLAGVELNPVSPGSPTFLLPCTTGQTSGCVAVSDTTITVKPPSSLSGQFNLSVGTAQLSATSSLSASVIAATTLSGVGTTLPIEFTSGPVVTGISS